MLKIQWRHLCTSLLGIIDPIWNHENEKAGGKNDQSCVVDFVRSFFAESVFLLVRILNFFLGIIVDVVQMIQLEIGRKSFAMYFFPRIDDCKSWHTWRVVIDVYLFLFKVELEKAKFGFFLHLVFGTPVEAGNRLKPIQRIFSNL